MCTYYTLTDRAPEVGSALTTDPADTYVATDPRALPVTEMTDEWPTPYQAATDIIESTTLTLIRVEPVGDVTGPDEFGCFTASGGWTVAGVEPSTDPVLGPQAARLREVAAEAEKSLTGLYDTDAVSAAYCDAVNDRYDAVRPHVAAAEDVLQRIGADGVCWTGCTYGQELLALAARDQLGTTPLWTQEAYDALTEPWRLVMRTPVHPDDTAPIPVA